MPVLIQILVVLCLIVVCKDLLLIVLFRRNFKFPSGNEDLGDKHPFVSVIVAARNEANNIERCIKALDFQDYPRERFEILVGNDRSEDDTLKVLKELESSLPNLRVFDIQTQIQKKPGKMNTLAILGKNASGKIFLFTDADTVVPPGWITTMVRTLQNDPENGIVTGSTLVNNTNYFGRLQGIEWVHAIGMIKVVSDLNIDVTAMGNNMAIERRTYESVGGYEGIPFSLTEDHEIYTRIRRKGNGSFQLFAWEALAQSNQINTISGLLMQRKRWMVGAFRLHIGMLTLLVLNALFYPIIIWLIIKLPVWGFILFTFKLLSQSIFIGTAFSKLDTPVRWWDLICYELYATVINLGSIILFILPFRIRWKGQKY